MKELGDRRTPRRTIRERGEKNEESKRSRIQTPWRTYKIAREKNTGSRGGTYLLAVKEETISEVDVCGLSDEQYE